MKKHLLILIPLLFVNFGFDRDGDKDTTAIVKASYIYNIAKLVDWSDPGKKQGNFVIGIMSESNLYQELIKKYSNKSIGKQPIEIRKMARSASVGKCHLLYVPNSAVDLMPNIYSNLANSGTMILTEYPGALAEGAVINFVATNSVVKFELNVANAK